MDANYTVEQARPEHLPALSDIERAAATLFRGWSVPRSVLEESTPLEVFQAAQAAGLLWVAVSDRRRPVGFALVEWEGNRAHLEEMDVHPRHGRRGIGSALVEAVCAWARERGCESITLTTYKDMPWNRPFYARLGFEVLGPADLTSELRERVEAEAARGLEPARRVVMRRVLSAG